MGFDSGPPGASAAELVRMVEGGLTSAEGLAAATAGSAAALGSDEVGAVEPGRSADLLVVDGDPSSDVRVLADWARIWLVLRDGRPVAGTALEATGPSSCPEPPRRSGRAAPRRRAWRSWPASRRAQ